MIESIRITGFRSCKDVAIDDVSDLTAIVGRNGVGKSNILRALNLFFNGEPEDGQPLDMKVDFGGSRRNRRIQVEVGFDLPSGFNFRSGIHEAADRLGWDSGERFSIRREWSMDPDTQTIVDSLFQKGPSDDTWGAFDEPDRRYVELLLTRLIRFRYIPNHVHPLELIRAEQESLQHELIAKINRSRALKEEVDTAAPLDAMTGIAANLLAPVVKRISGAAPELQTASLLTPESWADIAMTLEVRLGGDGQPQRSANLHGSGHQSLLAYALLHLLDSSFSTKFGWHQATIWGIEEPESYLHQELAYQVGLLLRELASQQRFQILATTHSPVFMAHATSGIVMSPVSVEVAHGRALIEKGATAGASAYVHPLLAGAPKPLLIVEGPTDKDHVALAYRLRGRTNPWEIRSIEEFGVARGETGMDQLLKYHASPISARPASSPVVMLVDLDQSSGRVESLTDRLRKLHPHSGALRLEPDGANPDLDLSCFTGIEGYLSTRILEAASAAGAVVLLRPDQGTPIGFNVRSNFQKMRVVEVCRDAAVSADYSYLYDALDRAEAIMESQ